MNSSKAEQASNYRAIQALILVFSFIFFFIIAFGYANLFSGAGAFFAVLGGIVLATFAWFLARVMGSGAGGPSKNWALFIPLFVVSGAGVYNSLMLNLEGSQIISDSITQSQGRLEQLQVVAEQGLSAKGAAERVNKANSLRESLFSEIRNPVNCGQGPEARRLISELRQALPGFTPLSMPNKDCSKNEEIIADYAKRIDDLIRRDPRNYPELLDVREDAANIRGALEKLRVEATTNYAPTTLHGSLKQLEAYDAAYRNARFRASRLVTVDDVPPSLPIEPVQSLGNAGKLPSLIMSRLGEPATWAYLFVAAGFDLLMVYLFTLAKNNRTRRVAAHNALSGAW